MPKTTTPTLPYPGAVPDGVNAQVKDYENRASDALRITSSGTPVQTCSRCKTVRPLAKFAKSTKTANGRRTMCTPCVRIQQSNIRQTNDREPMPRHDWSDVKVERDQAARKQRIKLAKSQYDKAQAYAAKPDCSTEEYELLRQHVTDLWQFATDEACDDSWSKQEQQDVLWFSVSGAAA